MTDDEGVMPTTEELNRQSGLAIWEVVSACISLADDQENYRSMEDFDLVDQWKHPRQLLAQQALDEVIENGMSERDLIWLTAVFLATEIKDGMHPECVPAYIQRMRDAIVNYEKKEKP